MTQPAGTKAAEVPHTARTLLLLEAQLKEERARADRAEAALRRARQATTTVMVPREYDEALRWRRQFLGLDEYEDDGPDLEISPLAAQLVCFLVADCMTLREVDAALSPAPAEEAADECSCANGVVCIRCPVHNPSGTWED